MRSAFAPHPELEEYLTQNGIAWSVLDRQTHQSIHAEWMRIYGVAFTFPYRPKHGVHAESEVANQTDERFFVVPFLGDRGGPHGVAKHGPRNAAYNCTGSLLPFGRFCAIDLFIAPPDLEWTMIHTHEDHLLGGPYFCRREWLVAPRHDWNPRNGPEPHRERRR